MYFATSLQQGFIFHALSQPEDDAYRVQLMLDYEGTMDVALFRKAWQLVLQTYPALRLCFNWDEQLIQLISKTGRLDFTEHDLSHVEDKEAAVKAIQEADRAQAFDLEEPTLLRVHLIKHHARHYTLLKSVHHSVLDGWSSPILLARLHDYYYQLIAGKTPSVVEDKAYLLAQAYITRHQEEANKQCRQQVEKVAHANDLRPMLSRAVDLNTVKVLNQVRESETLLQGEDYAAVIALAKKTGVTLNVIVQFAWHKLIQIYTQDQQTIVGTVVSGRSLPITGIESSVGPYINTLPLIIDWDERSVSEQLNIIHAQIMELNEYSFAHLASLQTEGERLFHSLFVFENYPIPTSPVVNENQLAVRLRAVIEKLDYQLAVSAHERDGALHLSLKYDETYLTQIKAEQLLASVMHIIRQIPNKLNEPSYAISVLTPADYQKIIYDWNLTAKNYPSDLTLHQLFEAQVERTPQALAVREGQQHLSYQELNEQANQLAHYLRRHYAERGLELKPNTLIAFCMDRSINLVITLLAILKAGAAFVPMHPNDPLQRMQEKLKDTGSAVLLTQMNLLMYLYELVGTEIVPVISDLYQTEPIHNLLSTSKSVDLAYVIYTSGTTGVAKGVMIRHYSVNNLVMNQNAAWSLSSQDRVLQYAPIAFDAAISELFTTLTAGAALVLISEEKRIDPVLLMDFLQDQQVSVATLPPALLKSIAYQSLPLLKVLIVAGEVCDLFSMSRWSQGRRLFNAYGPTESTVCALMHEYQQGDSNTLIGRPLANVTVYVLDKHLQPLPVGVIGELYISGMGLARGYLNQEELSSERFINNPFSEGEEYSRLYKTGDLVRWLDDGTMEYVGRSDFQVKIRGYRIELGEVEQVLASHPSIVHSLVTVSTRQSTPYLIGYYLSDEVLEQETLRAHCGSRLPEYMVPTVFMQLREFPLTVNGKLDRDALPEPEFKDEGVAYAAPRTELESRLCLIWQELLGVERVGIHDDFFRIGGDSILSIQVTSRMRQEGLQCSVKAIFDHRTVARLAQFLGSEANALPALVAEQGVLTGSFGLLPIQSWFFEQHYPQAHHWNQSFMLRVPALSVKRLRQIVPKLVIQHDMLRACFIPNAAGLMEQRYQAELPALQIHELDVSTVSVAEQEALLTSWQSDFDLAHGPLWQMAYLDGYEDGSARIYLAFHHLLVDGVSWRILADDLKCLYNGEELGEKSSSYRQWVGAVTRYGQEFQAEVAYWRDELVDCPILVQPDSATVRYDNLELDQPLTRQLLSVASHAYRTEVNDLLLTALACALTAYDGDLVHGVMLEGHGRELIDETLDTSRTMGWFTTAYPVRLESAGQLENSIKRIKEKLRHIPNKGIGFGALRSELSSLALPRIGFNYLGQFDSASGDWQVVNEWSGQSIHPDNKSSLLIDINGMVAQGQLHFVIASRLSLAEHQRFTSLLKAQLIAVIEHCVSRVERNELSYTPSDFSSVTIDADLLNKVQAHYSIEAIYPAASLQQGFIYHALSQPEDDAYRVQLMLDYEGALNVAAYRSAWQLALQTYPALRLCFNWEAEPIQVVSKTAELRFIEHDLSAELDKEAAVKAIQQADRKEAFDLTTPGLIRIHLMKQDARHYTLLKSVHHSILDGWSGPVLMGCVHDYYYQLLAGQTPKVVEDKAYFAAQAYIAAHQEEANRQCQAQVERVTHANDLTAFLSKPVDWNRVKTVEQASERETAVRGEEYAALGTLMKRTGVTLNVIVQFAWHQLIQKYTQDRQTIVGTVVSGRSIPIEGIESSVGPYINTLPLVIDWEERTVEAQLHAIHEQIITLNEHSFAELATLQRGGERLFHSLLVFENYPIPSVPQASAERLSISLRGGIEKLDYLLALTAFEWDGALRLRLNFDEQYVTGTKAEAILASLTRIMKQIPSHLEAPTSSLSVLSAEEYHQLVYGWNQTTQEYPHVSLQQMFSAQARRTPRQVALVLDEKTMTYQELEERSNQLAHWLASRVQPGALVTLCLERSMEMVVAILGVLKAGAAYVPTDPDYPLARIQYVIDDTQSTLVLTQRHVVQKLTGLTNTHLVCLDEEPYAAESVQSIALGNGPDDLAYVMYTSGTTGKPKGVLLTHRGLVNRIHWMQKSYPLDSSDVVLHKTPYTFDVSVWELLWAHWVGARLVLAKPGGQKDGDYLYELMQKHRVSVVHFVPSMLSAFTQVLVASGLKVPASLRHVFCSGEALSAAQVNAFYDVSHTPLRLHNLYGPTEASIDVTSHTCEHGESVVVIGKPIQNMRTYVLNAHQEPVPVGVVGELYLGGVGLALGYLNQPELTAQCFINNPFGEGRLYRTGDLVRWLTNGTLEYIGRADFQVKLRGYRIELAEIEAVVSSHPAIQHSVVLVHKNLLVAYYLSTTVLQHDELRAYCAQQLPEYMLPNQWIHLTSLPVTANGKLDRHALARLEYKYDEHRYTEPRTELESRLCVIWQEILNVEKIGIHDDFFQKGGHSILAIQLVQRMRHALAIHIPVSEVFKHKTIAQLLGSLNLANSQQHIVARDLMVAPLSFAQERLWFIERYEQGTNAYHIPLAFEFDAHMDKSALKQALQAIVHRHTVLRSVFVQDEQGIDFQRVEKAPLAIIEHSIQYEELATAMHKDSNREFNLTNEYPIRACLYHLVDSGRVALLLTIHHVAFDAWSIRLLTQELRTHYLHFAEYARLDLPELTVQYNDFAVWQREYLSSTRKAEQVNYWRTKLKGYESVNMPLDFIRPKQVDYHGDNYLLELEEGLSQDLRAFAHSQSTTLYTVLLTGFYIVLARYTGQDDLVIGTPIANRHYPQIESLIGFFVNTLALRLRLNPQANVLVCLEEVKNNLIEAQQYQDIPFETLVNELEVPRDLSRHPLFQIMFDLYREEGNVGPNDFVKTLELEYKVAKFDLTVSVHDIPNQRLRVTLNYATSLFKVETIARLAKHYKRVLEQMLVSFSCPISEYSLMTADEYQEIVYNWNAQEKVYPRDKTMDQLFEEWVAQTPNKLALVFENQQLTYKELNDRANQLANAISATGLKPDTLIGLCFDRSLDLVVAILGVLKAGGAYVPIDPAYPEERVRFILDDSRCSLLLTHKHLVDTLETVCSAETTIMALEAAYSASYQLTRKTRSANDLAYVIYTSGTTGTPKGVMQTHGNVARLFSATQDYFHFNDDDSWVLFHSYVFDFSVWEMWGALVNGGTLIIPTEEERRDMFLFSQLCTKYKVSILNFTPSVFSVFTAAVSAQNDLPASVRCIVLGGEELTKAHLSLWDAYPDNVTLPKLVNMYGITETTVHVTLNELVRNEQNSIHLGRAIPDLRLYVLDKEGQPLPVGIVGELHVGGAGLARGYLNQEALTQSRFITNRFASTTDKSLGYTRLYKTGDLVRWRSDGNLEYIGRNDSQTKIRGFRIELSEVETALLKYQGMKQCTVLVIEQANNKYLVAYYVRESAVDVAQLNAFLAQRLSDYMMPAAFVHLTAFPVTINGKLDRTALPVPQFENEMEEYSTPETALESRLCRLWREILSIDRVGINDDFFRIGGDSILSIQLIARMRQEGLSCSVKAIFEQRTIKRLALWLTKNSFHKQEVNAEQGLLKGSFSLLPIQSWFFEQNFTKPSHWNQSSLIKVPELSLEKLAAILEPLADYHDMLRARFVKTADGYQQYYQETIELPTLYQLNVSGLSSAAIEAQLTQWQSNFNLEQGPLWRIAYLYGYSDYTARIFMAAHHLIIDAVSWRILLNDIRALYKDRVLLPKSSSYRQWVAHITGYALKHESEQYVYERQLSGLPTFINQREQIKRSTYTNYYSLVFNEEQSRGLLTTANSAYQTQINELLLTALAYALQAYEGSDVQGVTIEGHGREELDTSLDTTRTLGWFTTLYPVKLALQSSLADSIVYIKESLRAIPNKGVGYGALRQAGMIKQLDLPPIFFNYLGQVTTQDGSWQFTAENSGFNTNSADTGNAVLTINAIVFEGELRINWSSKLDEHTIKNIAEEFKFQLESILAHCIAHIRQELVEQAHEFVPFERFNSTMSRSPVFIFPPGDGGAESYYNNLVPLLKSQHLVLFNNYLTQPHMASIASFELLAKCYLLHLKTLQPKGPYVLGGWSFGAVLALEIARQLNLEGESVSKLILLDPYLNYKKALQSLQMHKKTAVNLSDFGSRINYQYAPPRFTLHDAEIVLIKCMKQTVLHSSEDNRLLRQQVDFEAYYSSVYDNHLSDYLVNPVQRIEINATHSSWTSDYEASKLIAEIIATRSGSISPVNTDMS